MLVSSEQTCPKLYNFAFSCHRQFQYACIIHQNLTSQLIFNFNLKQYLNTKTKTKLKCSCLHMRTQQSSRNLDIFHSESRACSWQKLMFSGFLKSMKITFKNGLSFSMIFLLTRKKFHESLLFKCWRKLLKKSQFCSHPKDFVSVINDIKQSF